MDPAIQTNLNGVNTLTKKMKEVKDTLAELQLYVDSITLNETNKELVKVANKVDLNSVRIANIKKQNFDVSIKRIESALNDLFGLVNTVTGQAASNCDKLAAQDKAIHELNTKINGLLPLIETNAVGIDQVDNKTQHNLGAIGAISEDTDKLGVKLDVVKDRLADTDEVVKGCIIGIDKNTSSLTEADVKIANSILIISRNKIKMEENRSKIDTNTENLETNFVQTRTNSKSIQTLSMR